MIDPDRRETPSLASTRLRNEVAAATVGPDDVTVADGTTAQTFCNPPDPAASMAGASVAWGPASIGTPQPRLARAARMAGVAPPSSMTTIALGWSARRPARAEAAPAPDGDTDARPTIWTPSLDAAAANPAAPCRLATSPVTTRATVARPCAAENLAITCDCTVLALVTGNVSA